MVKRLKGDVSSPKGQSLVEFAFGLVVVLILLTGIVDTGRALFTYLALRDAAQEGALYASTNPDISKAGTKLAVINRVCNSSNYFQGLTCGDPVDTPSAPIKVAITLTGSACTGNAVTVNVSYNQFPLTMPFIGALVGSQTIGISARVTDTILAPACK